MIKKILTVLILIHFTNNVLGQCNCQTKEYSDIKLIICPPSPVNLSDKNYVPALSISKIGDEVYLILTVRFREKAQLINSDLTAFIKNDRMLRFKYVKSEKAFVNNSELSHTQFELSGSDISYLKVSDLKSIIFSFENDDLKRTVPVVENASVLANHINCIK